MKNQKKTEIEWASFQALEHQNNISVRREKVLGGGKEIKLAWCLLRS